MRQSSPLKMGICTGNDPPSKEQGDTQTLFPGSCWLVGLALTALARPHFRLQPPGMTPGSWTHVYSCRIPCLHAGCAHFPQCLFFSPIMSSHPSRPSLNFTSCKKLSLTPTQAGLVFLFSVTLWDLVSYQIYNTYQAGLFIHRTAFLPLRVLKDAWIRMIC